MSGPDHRPATPDQTNPDGPTDPDDRLSTMAEAVIVELGGGSPQDESASTDSTGSRATPTLWEQMGGPIGMLDSGLPVVVFVVVNALTSLGWAVGAALTSGVLIAVLRLARRTPASQAIGGLFAVGVAAFIAHRTGSAKGYFLFGIWSFVAYGFVLLLSVLVRRPLIGLLWEGVNGRGSAWRADRTLVRRYDLATLVWVAVFAARFAVQHRLYDSDHVGWLATARLLMGYPLYLLAIVATVLIVGRAAGMHLPWSRRKGAVDQV